MSDRRVGVIVGLLILAGTAGAMTGVSAADAGPDLPANPAVGADANAGGLSGGPAPTGTRSPLLAAAQTANESGTATSLTLQVSDGPASFGAPATAAGRLTDEDGVALADREVSLVVDDRVVTTTRTDRDGRYETAYRPVRTRTGETTLTAVYRPTGADREAYRRSNATADVVVEAATPTVALDLGGDRAGFGDRLDVTAAVTVDGTAVSGVEATVLLAEEPLAVVETDEDGSVTRAVTVPATVPDGDRELRVVVSEPGRAIEATTASRSVRIEETATDLTVDGRLEEDAGDLVVSGELRTEDGEAVPNRPVRVSVDGEELAVTETDADGAYKVTFDRGVGPENTWSITASFDGEETNLASTSRTTRVSTGLRAVYDGLVGAGSAGAAAVVVVFLVAVAGIGAYAYQQDDEDGPWKTEGVRVDPEVPEGGDDPDVTADEADDETTDDADPDTADDEAETAGESSPSHAADTAGDDADTVDRTAPTATADAGTETETATAADASDDPERADSDGPTTDAPKERIPTEGTDGAGGSVFGPIADGYATLRRRLDRLGSTLLAADRDSGGDDGPSTVRAPEAAPSDTESGDDATPPPSTADPPSGGSLGAARQRLDEGEVAAAVTLAYRTVREALAAADGMETSLTHREFYHEVDSAVDWDDEDDPLWTLTEAYEQAAFTPDSIDRTAAETALEAATQCLAAVGAAEDGTDDGSA